MRGRILGITALVSVAACGSLNPAKPSAFSASGTWTGNVTIPEQVAHMTWRLTQNGDSVSGPVEIDTSSGGVVLTGALSGVFNNATLSFSIVVPAGQFADQPTCGGRLDGNARLALGAPSVLSGAYTWGSTACAARMSSGTFTLTSGDPLKPSGPVQPSG